MKLLPRLLTGACVALAGVLHADAIAYRDSVPVANDDDRAVLDAFVGHAVSAATPNEDKIDKVFKEDGVEMLAWIDFKNLNLLNTAYELTGDTQYLDLFKQGMQHYLDRVTVFTDGYRGWSGVTIPPRKPKDNPDKQVEEIQSTFRGIYVLARWVALAKSAPDYAAANEATIKEYLDLCENNLFPKWDARGYWTMLTHAGGVYHGLDYPDSRGVSLSFEKLSIMVEGLLALHDASGKPLYLKRALQIGAWYKSNLIPKDGHYEWMSWVPAGPWDINPDNPEKWKVGWMAPDPNAGWYITAQSIALNLYQRGLLFDDADIDMFVKTATTMCWNGDMENPEFRNVAGETSKWIKGEFFSDQLAPYDQKMSTFGFEGYRAKQALADKDSSWKGGIQRNDYIEAKFLMRPQIDAGTKQPLANVGETFLADDANRAFYERLKTFAVPTNAAPPTSPGMMFADPALAAKAYNE
ncbi:hypothetical protein [Cerasicoccus fimbriatus]|uniref:hypothetical protein n=1 Tax=Cerasicoccus fimbriatus TaxID=3014554 RepID=UPI0022B591C0|nr:hypothetical protein [Cerasicoccus sp. TK19100]